jgi:hypothetical protein
MVVPVGPGTRVRYLVNLLSVPQDPDMALTNNKVLPEQGGSVLTSLLLLAAKNSAEEEEEEGEDLFFQVAIQLNLLVRYRMHESHFSTCLK